MSKRSWQINHLILLGAACLALHVHAQNSAPPISVTVIVANAITQPPQPVKAAHVSLTHLISAQLAVDAQGPTNPRGEAQLLVSQSAARNGDLRIVISGASNLVIYEPADGQLSGLKSPVRVVLLPTGSLALLGPAQIQAYLHRLLLQVNSLQKQVGAQKATAAQGQGPQQYLTASLADFAQATGFSHDQVDQQVAIWAQSIKLQAAQATTAEQRALAAFALKDYASAAADYKQAADATRQQINGHEASAAAHEKARENDVDAARNDLRQLINQCQASAGADQLGLKFHDATEVLESAVATADTEYKKHPDDIGFRNLWLLASSVAANARWQEGQFAPAEQSLPLLAQSATEFEALAREYAALGDRQAVASAQDGLGLALMDEGRRAGGDRAVSLLDQAVQSYRSALEVYSRTYLPRDWAQTQNNLASALESEGERVGGDNAGALFDQAVQAYRSALEVFTKADLPEDWAMIQSNLGYVLDGEGERASGDKAIALLDQAVQAFRSALEVFTKADLPHDWAASQDNLGNVLADEGMRASGDQATALFDQAVQAFRNVLEFRTKADLPQDWAVTQNNLGLALWEEGLHASGDRATALFDQAAQAFRRVLEVDTQANLPQDWARTQNNLALALDGEGRCTSGPAAVALLDQAVQAYRSAFEIYTRADLPQSWARTQNNFGGALVDEGERTGGGQAAALFDQAVQAYRGALEVRTKAGLPQSWLQTQGHLVTATLVAGRFQACLQEAALLGDPALPPYQVLAGDVLSLACEWGAGNKRGASQTEMALLAQAAEFPPGYRDFGQEIYFLSNSPLFAKGRPSWVALFTAVQNGDSAGMTAALHQLEPILQR